MKHLPRASWVMGIVWAVALSACANNTGADVINDSESFRISDDLTYGYTEDNPVHVGGALFQGARREHWYLDHLTGPEGQPIDYLRTGSCCAQDELNTSFGSSAIDLYEITYPGLPEPITLYIDMYSCKEPLIPDGFGAQRTSMLPEAGTLAFLGQPDIFIEGVGLAVFVLDSATNCMHEIPVQIDSDLPIALSSDGSKIAYTSHADAGSNLLVVELSDGSSTQITDSIARDIAPAWSPNGQLLAFTRITEQSSLVHIVDLASGQAQQLTDGNLWETTPSWSVDGGQIIFGAGNNDGFDLYSMRRDGSNRVRLTDTAAPELYPQYSPDGEQLAYILLDESDGVDIYIAGADGSNPRQVTKTAAAELAFTWSPDGMDIAFCRLVDETAVVYVVPAMGGAEQRLNNARGSHCFPSWSG